MASRTAPNPIAMDAKPGKSKTHSSGRSRRIRDLLFGAAILLVIAIGFLGMAVGERFVSLWTGLLLAAGVLGILAPRIGAKFGGFPSRPRDDDAGHEDDPHLE